MMQHLRTEPTICPPEARWSTIINTTAPKLNVALDTALHSIATNSSQLKGCFIESTFTNRNLAPNDIKKLVDEVNKISHKAFGEEKDLIGRVYGHTAEFVFASTQELKTEGRNGSKKILFKTYFIKTVKRMKTAFDVCQPSGEL